MKYKLFLLPLAALAMPQPAAAADPQPKRKAAAYEALTRCRTLPDPAERFACLEAAAAGLEAAVDKGEVAIVDRQQIRETRQTLFGLNLPRLPVFGDREEAEEEQVRTVESTIEGATQDENGGWIMRLANGATWRQVDGNVLALRPRAGQKVVISAAAMGSYMMRVNNQPGIRVRRVN